MVFHWSLSDSRYPHVFRNLLSILADLNNVVWMVSTRSVISKSSSSWTNHLVAVPRAPITTGITVTFIFHSFFFNSVARYLSFLLLSFNFTLWSTEIAKSTIVKVFFFVVIDCYKVWSSGLSGKSEYFSSFLLSFLSLLWFSRATKSTWRWFPC